MIVKNYLQKSYKILSRNSFSQKNIWEKYVLALYSISGKYIVDCDHVMSKAV